MDIILNLDNADYALLAGGVLCSISILMSRFKKGKWQGFNNSKNWHKVNATIVSSAIKDQAFHSASRTITGWEDDKAYAPSISYKYRCQGKSYTSSRIGASKTISTNKDSSQKVLDKYPVGKEVVAYVNPKKPRDACLEPIGNEANFMYLASIGFPVIAIIVIYMKHMW